MEQTTKFLRTNTGKMVEMTLQEAIAVVLDWRASEWSDARQDDLAKCAMEVIHDAARNVYRRASL